MPAIVHIDSLALGGDGVGRLEGGRVVFVPGAAPGDILEVELYEEKERQARGRIVRVVEASPERAEPPCPHASRCGSCSWMHLKLQAQEEAKARLLREALQRLGGVALDRVRLATLIRSPKPLRYRRRATLHLASGRLGYRAPGSHELVEIPGCPQLDERLEEGLATLRRAFAEVGPVPRCADVALACDDRRLTAAFFVSGSGGKATAGAALQRVERVARSARLDGAVLVPEGGRGQAVGKAVLSFPAPHAEGVTLHGRADLFAQANAGANELLVGEAMRMLAGEGQGAGAGTGEGGEALLELYSGAGNLTFAAARRGFQVTAVESEPDAVELARRSAREAAVGSVRFVQGDALRIAEALAREGKRYQALLLDPPRTGAKGVAAAARRIGARRVVYVSCDPGTLARDVRDLERAGYRLVEVVGVDMFPQTFHLEAVALLEQGAA